jgi:GT2 family glycosyltransferase
VQGRTVPDPDEEATWFGAPWAHTQRVEPVSPEAQTCNIGYPRELLERLGGFDQERFPRVAGEDTDLGWRAIEAGARPVFASDACVYHAIVHVGPVARLRISWRWSDVVANYRLHPEMPKYKGVFWRHNHYELARFLLALALPKRLEAVRLMLAAPYLTHLTMRRTGPLIAPYLLLLDLTEMGAIVRGAIRHRVLVV